MDFIVSLVIDSIGKVLVSFSHNWLFLLASVLISVGLKLYIRPEKVSAYLTRYRKVGVLGATAAAVTTPFCSCGTTAVILGMIASTVPWAPIVAFMVASPLTSPEELIYSAGLFGWPFAIAFFVSSIVLGLLGGAAAAFCEARGWLANQARFRLQAEPPEAAKETRSASSVARETASCGCQSAVQPVSQLEPMGAAAMPLPAYAVSQGFIPAAAMPAAACGCSSPAAPLTQSSATCGCDAASQAADTSASEQVPAPAFHKVTLQQWGMEIYQTGGKLLVMFLGFAFLGYLLNGLIPPAWVTAIFGKGNLYSVPLAAMLGLPLYINTEGSLPLVRALIDGGMSQGAALAFLITGAGTSTGAIGGALTIARWRVIALVVGTLWLGAVVLGFAYNLLLAAHLF